jgi:hypothetical protein
VPRNSLNLLRLHRQILLIDRGNRTFMYKNICFNAHLAIIFAFLSFFLLTKTREPRYSNKGKAIAHAQSKGGWTDGKVA